MKKTIMLGIALLSLSTATMQGATIDGFALAVDGVPNSVENDLAFLNTAIANYNGLNAVSGTTLGSETYYLLPGPNPPSEAPVAIDIANYRIATPLSATVSLNGPVEYIVAHWGGQYGGVDIMYYLDWNTLTTPSSETPLFLTLTTDGALSDIRIGGISSITFFGASVTSDSGTSVPDGGTSLALFGMGLCGLFTFARYQKKA